MKKKGLEVYLYSAVGVAAMLIILIAINFIAARGKQRIDLTAEKAYTLSAGTKAIIARLDTPVQIRFYCTRGENALPVFLKTYAQRVEDLLGEYRQASKGLIEIQKLDPVPDSDAEDSARLDGIEGQGRDPLGGGEPYYVGLSVSMLDQKEAIPFLTPERERLLEYDISRAITRVLNSEKPVIGVMSSLPVNGQGGSPMMQQRQRGSQPWVIMSELHRDFAVKPVEMTVDKIPDEIKTLVVIHPKGLTDAGQYAIDQFILRGGKLIAFLDPTAVLDQQQPSQMGMPPPSTSTMEKLLKAWGLSFETTKIVADMDFQGQTRAGPSPVILALNEKAVNKEDIVTASTDNLVLVFAGAFSGSPTEGLKETVLIKSSKNSQLVDPMMAQIGGDQIKKSFVKSDAEFAFAVRLSGKFKTAFPDGKPKTDAKPEDPNSPEKKPEAPAEAGLKESEKENTVILVGDTDFLQDQVTVNPINGFGGQRIVMPQNGNLAFAQGAIEQLTGDDNLITVRSRASRERPFTVVKEMQAKAEAAYQGKIKELETSLSEAQRKVNELQQSKKQEAGQRFILSPEQQKEIENFKKKETEVKKQLKEERKKLRTEVDALANRTKFYNIALMPLLVTLFGVGLAIARRNRRAAR